jgi:phosphatidylethanolamine/phosphatidyl-N-methylethanolamine N-methyltransferase
VLPGPAASVVSGLPLMTKPMITRLRLLTDAFALLDKNGPFIQFTYAVVPPIPTDFNGVSAEGSDLVWMNLPPARVWVYRHR